MTQSERWPLVPLGELVRETQYGTSAKSNEQGRGQPVLRMNNVSRSGQLDLRDLKHVELDDSERRKLDLRRGDILFNRTNSRELVGKTAVWDRDGPFTFAGYLVRVRVREDRVLPAWVAAFMNSPAGKTTLFHMAKPSINMANISASDLLRLEVPVPPLKHQRESVHLLEKADYIRRKRREAVALTEKLLRSAFLEMFGDPVANAKRWPTKTLGDLAAEMRYGTSEKCSSDNVRGSLPVLRIPNVSGGYVNWRDLKFATLDQREVERLTLRSGDILFVRSNGNPEYIARCAVYEDARAALFASYLIRVRLHEAGGLPTYLQAALSADSYRHVLTKAARTTAGNYNISTEGLRALVLPIPPPALRREYMSIERRVAGQLLRISEGATLADGLFGALVDRALRVELPASAGRRSNLDSRRGASEGVS